MSLYDKIKHFRQFVRKNLYDVFFMVDEVLTVINKHILKANGEILEIIVEEDEIKKNVFVTAKAKLEIVNNSEIPVRILNPKYFEQSEVKYFAAIKKDSQWISENLYSSSYSKSLTGNKCNSGLGGTINENAIPENTIIPLNPEEKYSWNDDIYFEFHTTDTKRGWQGVSWKEFRSYGNLFRFRFEYRVLEEIASLKPELYEILPDDWQEEGEIPIARYKIKNVSGQKSSLEIEPIFIDFTHAKFRES